MGWLVASTIVIAAIQRAVYTDGEPRFLLKGGTLLQHRLGKAARATSDIDGLVRGDIDDFIDALDLGLAEPWGPLTLSRSEVEIIATPTRLIAPRRFHVYVALRGQPWRKIQVEISPDEAGAGAEPEHTNAPTLEPFGLPAPDTFATLALNYQIAQKIHACSDPHDPPNAINDRPRDVVDLLLLRELVDLEGAPTYREILDATLAVFDARATEAAARGFPPRQWPTIVHAHAHWGPDYARAAHDAGFTLALDDATSALNSWLAQVADASD